jgi:hypothetical protein
MREICIGPRSQAAMMLGVVAAVGAAVTVQLPEIRRYLRIRQM